MKHLSGFAYFQYRSETRYVDWTDLFFGTGVNQNYQLSVANGTEKLQYFVSEYVHHKPVRRIRSDHTGSTSA